MRKNKFLKIVAASLIAWFGTVGLIQAASMDTIVSSNGPGSMIYQYQILTLDSSNDVNMSHSFANFDSSLGKLKGVVAGYNINVSTWTKDPEGLCKSYQNCEGDIELKLRGFDFTVYKDWDHITNDQVDAGVDSFVGIFAWSSLPIINFLETSYVPTIEISLGDGDSSAPGLSGFINIDGYFGDVVLEYQYDVPEPSTFFLFIIGITCFAWLRRCISTVRNVNQN